MSTTWSFDLGKASIGEAVRDIKTNDFLHIASLLVPAEFASTKDARDRRRMYRTRQAHKAREAWLDEVWRAAGQEPLRKRTVGKNDVTKKWELKHPADERLEREFPGRGDTTCYTSSLLRIKLLRGEKLEPWQIYKALHSAIQRRGYDPNIPWKAKESRRREQDEDDKEEAGTRARMEHFVAELKAMFPTHEDCQLPCYFDAVKMGLCDPAEPDVLRERIDCHAESTRDQVVPRWLVEKEIRLLADAAGKQIAGLADRADFLLWGPALKPYASYDLGTRKKLGLREGGANDWQGVVSQKVPRFDNRIIDKCALIPRLNVCKIKTDGKNPLPESRIVFEATFLMKLKNMRVQRTPREQTGLTAAEIKVVFEDPKLTGFKVTVAQWRKLCAKFGVHPLPGCDEVEPPRGGGRSRFCRPALDILKRLILSGQNPADFHREELARLKGNTDPKRGLVADDLKFLLQMGGVWDGIYIPNQKLDAILQRGDDADAAIREIVGSQNDPIVRHRLNVFYQRIQTLRAAHGVPETVVLEFVREDFMGKKAVIEYRAFLKKRETERKRAREDAAKTGATERSAALKLELLREQGGICLYTGDGLHETKLDEYEIDHIVPRSKGGPDAVINYVLTTRARNFDKAERTPFEWLSKTNGWDAYVQRVRGRGIALRNKKVKLLLSEDAAELAERYTALAETAWISKLSRAILDAFFGWRNGNDANGVKRIAVVNGGLTARIRRKYKLNSLLNPDAADEEEAEKKNRSDDRHHALDAMVISFIPGWTRDSAKEYFFRLPGGVHRETFAQHIAEVMPQNLCLEKPVLAETIYGARDGEDGKVIVQRAEVVKLAYKPINPSKSVYDLAYAAKQFKAIRDTHIRRLLEEFIRDEPREDAWKDFCARFALRREDGSKAGSRVMHVLMNVGAPVEYADLSKDGSGAWRKAKQGHKGQIVWLDTQGKPRIRPVYAFESVRGVTQQIMSEGGTVYGFFRSGCLVSIAKPVTHTVTPLEPGIYRLNTIKAVGQVKVTDIQGRASLPISISKFIEAQLKPLHALEAMEQATRRKQALARL
jgi:CRISPR-associated endonuclease Csn1